MEALHLTPENANYVCCGRVYQNEETYRAAHERAEHAEREHRRGVCAEPRKEAFDA